MRRHIRQGSDCLIDSLRGVIMKLRSLHRGTILQIRRDSVATFMTIYGQFGAGDNAQTVFDLDQDARAAANVTL